MHEIEEEQDEIKPVGYTTAFNKIASHKRKLRFYCGGTGASKTTSILQYLILLAQKRTLRISIVGKNLRKLNRGAYKGQYGFIDILKKMGLYDPKNHNLTHSTYMLGESLFEFFGADDELGSRRDILFINEGTEISFEAFSQLEMRTKYLTIVDFNPKNEYWFHSEILGKRDCDYITLTYKDNEFLDESIVEDIESWEELGKTSEHYANKWRVFGLGQLGIQEGAIYKDWKEINSIPVGAELIASGLDFGWHPDPASLVSLWHYDGKIIVDEVIYEGKIRNSQLAQRIKDSGVNDAIIYADSASPQNIAELRHFGINVLPVTKGQGSVAYGIGIVNENSPFLVTSTSKNLIKELYGYIWATDKDDKQLSVPKGVDHACDAMRYAFRMKFSKKKTTFSLKWKR